MRLTMGTIKGRRAAVGLALGMVLLAGAGVTAAATATHAAGTPTWVTTQGKVVRLTLIANWNNVNAGFNFDGAAHGQMVITVPLGARIVATFKNNAQGTPHNAVIIPYTLPLPGRSTSPAFSGAASPAGQFRPGGSSSTQSSGQTFSFTASKAGRYMVVCGISGHALAGMWDTFVVSPSAKVATATFGTATTTGTTGTTAPQAKSQTWVTTSGKTVHLTLIAGWDNDNAGFNFDGASNGRMVVTVPLGAMIVATYRNAASTPHDVRIIKYQKPLPAHSVALAFPGASAGGPTGGFGRPPQGTPGAGGPPQGTPGPGGAPRMSNKPQTFTFVANKAGTYMIMCGFPGHALAGMWDTFVVSSTAKSASVSFR